MKNPFYVYALKDPREKPAKTFYIGKGTGTRAWEHQKEKGDSDKNALTYWANPLLPLPQYR